MIMIRHIKSSNVLIPIRTKAYSAATDIVSVYVWFRECHKNNKSTEVTSSKCYIQYNVATNENW